MIRRLDAIIRFLVEIMYAMKVPKFNQGEAARILWSVGLTPTEIAELFGKERAQDVAPYLYPKRRVKKR